MKVEIWSDIACPWCYIGKRRFEAALAGFEHRDDVEVSWRSYQLDPSLPKHYDGTEVQYLSERKGIDPVQLAGMLDQVTAQAAGVGLNYDFDSLVVANSFSAHRLIHLARTEAGPQRPTASRKPCCRPTLSRAWISAARRSWRRSVAGPDWTRTGCGPCSPAASSRTR
nr:DsbA family oxidoreductase [Arthrobacter sp. ATA002]